MRIGTWNMAGRSGPAHSALLVAQQCDVWLLTEVSARLTVADYVLHLGTAAMGPRKSWAAILSRHATEPLADPHPASAAARIAGRSFVSSVLPWPGGGEPGSGSGAGPAGKTEEAVRQLTMALSGQQVVWGGGWNDAVHGRDGAGTTVGREAITRALAGLSLQVPTIGLPHRNAGSQSTDHIAVPMADTVLSAHRISAVVDGQSLSDHDAYVIETA